MPDQCHPQDRRQGIPLPVMVGTEGEKAIDTRKLRADTGYICLRPGLRQHRLLRERDHLSRRRERHPPAPGLSDRAAGASSRNSSRRPTWSSTANCPTRRSARISAILLRQNAAIETQMQRIFEGFPKDAPPMAHALVHRQPRWPRYYPQLAHQQFREGPRQLRPRGRHGHLEDPHHRGDDLPLPATACRSSIPKQELPFCDNFLHMMFSEPYKDYVGVPEVARALNLAPAAARRPRAELQHLDRAHGRLQRAPISSPRSSAGICALSGPLHGGANVGGHADAPVDPRRGRRRHALHRGREVRRQEQPPDGLRPRGLPQFRPAREDHRPGLRRRAQQARHQRPAARHRQEPRAGRAARTTISSRASSTRTSISTAASSCARSASR